MKRKKIDRAVLEAAAQIAGMTPLELEYAPTNFYLACIDAAERKLARNNKCK